MLPPELRRTPTLVRLGRAMPSRPLLYWPVTPPGVASHPLGSERALFVRRDLGAPALRRCATAQAQEGPPFDPASAPRHSEPAENCDGERGFSLSPSAQFSSSAALRSLQWHFGVMDALTELCRCARTCLRSSFHVHAQVLHCVASRCAHALPRPGYMRGGRSPGSVCDAAQSAIGRARSVGNRSGRPSSVPCGLGVGRRRTAWPPPHCFLARRPHLDRHCCQRRESESVARHAPRKVIPNDPGQAPEQPNSCLTDAPGEQSRPKFGQCWTMGSCSATLASAPCLVLSRSSLLSLGLPPPPLLLFFSLLLFAHTARGAADSKDPRAFRIVLPQCRRPDALRTRMVGHPTVPCFISFACTIVEEVISNVSPAGRLMGSVGQFAPKSCRIGPKLTRVGQVLRAQVRSVSGRSVVSVLGVGVWHVREGRLGARSLAPTPESQRSAMRAPASIRSRAGLRRPSARVASRGCPSAHAPPAAWTSRRRRTRSPPAPRCAPGSPCSRRFPRWTPWPP